jgi:hypothetical protein
VHGVEYVLSPQQITSCTSYTSAGKEELYLFVVVVVVVVVAEVVE